MLKGPLRPHSRTDKYVAIDLHRRRSVIVRMTPEGEKLQTVRITNDPIALSLAVAQAGPNLAILGGRSTSSATPAGAEARNSRPSNGGALTTPPP